MSLDSFDPAKVTAATSVLMAVIWIISQAKQLLPSQLEDEAVTQHLQLEPKLKVSTAKKESEVTLD